MAFISRKKRFKFDVSFDIEGLSMVPFVSGILFAKVRLMSGGTFVDYTGSVEVVEHMVNWRKKFQFPCKMVASVTSGVLEPCICRVSIRKELKGGRSYQKLGYADIDLAQFAGSGRIARRYLLDGYSSKHRQDNSILNVVLDLTLLSGDPCFKVPSMHQMEPLLVGNDTEGGALHAGNKGATANDDGAAGDGNGQHCGSVITTHPDPTTAVQRDACKSSVLSTVDSTGHVRNCSDQSKMSSSGYVSSAEPTHIRQLSADAALAFRHERSTSSGSSDTGAIMYASIPRQGKQKSDTQPSLVGERRLNLTRVNNDQLVDELMSGINFNSDNNEGAGTLQLFVTKDGTAVLGSSMTKMLSSTSASLTTPGASAVPPLSGSNMHVSGTDRSLFHAQYNTK